MDERSNVLVNMPLFQAKIYLVYKDLAEDEGDINVFYKSSGWYVIVEKGTISTSK
jgi:hypothetical protein